MTAQDRTEPVAVDTVVTGEWIITLNADREIYRDGAIAVSGGVITEVGNHLEAVLEALAASGIRARTGPWTWDQAGPAGADGLPDWLRMDADAARTANHPLGFSSRQPHLSWPPRRSRHRATGN